MMIVKIDSAPECSLVPVLMIVLILEILTIRELLETDDRKHDIFYFMMIEYLISKMNLIIRFLLII